MKITWMGTASIIIESDNSSLLFDPFVPLKGSDVPVTDNDFDGYENILVTHGHFDHIMNIPEIMSRNENVKVYCTETPANTLVLNGADNDRIVRISAGDAFYLGDFKITAYQGKHAELQIPDIKNVMHRDIIENIYKLPMFKYYLDNYPENGEILYYEVEAEGKRIGIMGSLNMDELTEYPKYCDLLVLPYNGWRDNLSHAEKIVNVIKPKKILLDHYDRTFPPLTVHIDLLPVKNRFSGRVIVIPQKHTITI